MKTFRFIGFAILLCLSACSGGDDDPIEAKQEEIKSEITINSNIITNGLSFSTDKGEQSISFSTNGNWTLSVVSNTWCTASATSGTAGNASVKFTVTENTDYDERSVSVTIKSGTASKTFTITQEGRPKPEEIQVEKAGSLGEKLNKIKSDIESLIIKGNINGDDIAALREFYSESHSLKSLDLLNVNIVEGGSFEYKTSYPQAWYKGTCKENNVIPNNMFNNGFRGLEELILPLSVISIGNNAFEECVSLKKIEIPCPVTTIGSGAFKNCTKLENIDLPETIISIGSGAFWQCNSLKSISIPEGVTEISSTTFYQCRNIVSISLPESLIEIKPMAFSQCSWGLKKIVIPKNVKKIGYQAFYECDKLENVTCLAETAPDIKHTLSDNTLIYAFDEDYRGNLSVPKYSYSSYRYSDWNKFFAIVEMDE